MNAVRIKQESSFEDSGAKKNASQQPVYAKLSYTFFLPLMYIEKIHIQKKNHKLILTGFFLKNVINNIVFKKSVNRGTASIYLL